MNFLVNFFVYLCMYLLIVVIAGYSKTEFHASDSLAGLVTGLFIVGSLIGRFITGKYVNAIGPKKTLLIGIIFLIITQLLYFIEGSLGFLMFTRLINGIATAVATTATGTIAAYITPPERKSEGISMFSLSLVLGTAIGPFFGLLLSSHYSIDILFGLCLVFGVVSLILSFFINIEFKTTPIAITEGKKGFSLNQFIALDAVPIAIVILITGLTYSSILTFLKFFAEERDLVTVSSYFFIFYAITSLVTRPVTGRLMDNKNENVVVYPAYVFLFATFVMLYFAHSGWLLLLAGAALGIGYGNLSSLMQAIAIKVTTPEKYGLATSTYFIGIDIGIGFGPSLLGAFTSSITYGQLYGAMAILTVITAILYFLLHGRKVKSLAG
ncbi:MFS transporter [Staphylococcus carnosus]|uniref:MFS transporter n=1 Tax=Staphylococcus carnosus TaxID=1281 RepID=UPI00081A8947|nr:multidrug MFS transporter [Staphylococcus carnosus]UTB81729.1 multidrug MFS transporter [Staphylococcus carnosus]UTB86545.1 multidrug MFS transporter [Staphylococcus carnosus]